MNEPISLRDAVSTANTTWTAESQTGSIGEGTAAQYSKALNAFLRYAEAHDVHGHRRG